MGKAKRLADGAKLLPFPASVRSRDANGGEARAMFSPPSIASRSWVGEWPCACGRRYRVLVEPLTFWPQSLATGFCSARVEDCVSCGARLEDAFALEAARVVLRLVV